MNLVRFLAGEMLEKPSVKVKAVVKYTCVLLAAIGGCIAIWQFSDSNGFGALWICFLVLVIPAIVFRRWLRKTFIGEKPKLPNLFHEAVQLPDLSNVNTSWAILTLSWSIDFKTSVRLTESYYLKDPISWVEVSLLSLFVGTIFAFITSETSVLIVVTFILMAIGFMDRRSAIQKSRRLLFPDQNAIRHAVLIVDTRGFREVAGKTVTSFQWSDIKWAREASGIVTINRVGEHCLIPNYAFRCREDARAFAATINALRRGIPEPKYDWSAYVPVEPTSEGVWPPPIR